MNKHDVSKYIDLLHRRTFILLHSGIDWKPEYEAELQQINQELALLRPLVDQKHSRRVRNNLPNVASCSKQCLYQVNGREVREP